MLLEKYIAMSALRSLNSLFAVLLCAAFAGCERKPWREEQHPPLPEKIKPENIPDGGGAA